MMMMMDGVSSGFEHDLFEGGEPQVSRAMGDDMDMGDEMDMLDDPNLTYIEKLERIQTKADLDQIDNAGEAALMAELNGGHLEERVIRESEFTSALETIEDLEFSSPDAMSDSSCNRCCRVAVTRRSSSSLCVISSHHRG